MTLLLETLLLNCLKFRNHLNLGFVYRFRCRELLDDGGLGVSRFGLFVLGLLLLALDVELELIIFEIFIPHVLIVLIQELQHVGCRHIGKGLMAGYQIRTPLLIHLIVALFRGAQLELIFSSLKVLRLEILHQLR